MALGFINLTLWAVWAAVVNDSGTMIAVSTTWFVALFNVVWYVLCRLGLRPFFSRLAELEPVPVPVTVGDQR